MKVNVPTTENKPIFSTDLQVRISDINYGNHLGHDSLVSLMHETRVRFLKQHGFTELNVSGIGMLLTHLTVNYKAEAFYADEIQIDIALGEISKTSIDFYYTLKLKKLNKEIANAVTTITFFDYKKSKVVKIPEEFLEVIK